MGLLDTVRQWLKEGWRPDVIVIDINFDDGGISGVQYLALLRKEPDCAALAVVLATGNQCRDLDQNKLTEGKGKLKPNTVELRIFPFALSVSKPVLSLPNGGERKNIMLLIIKPFMLRRTQHERLCQQHWGYPYAPT